jgi:uncharacterized protein (TIGR03435 family)
MSQLFGRLGKWSKVEAIGVGMPGVRLTERVRQIIDAAPAVRISRPRMASLVAVCAAICGVFLAVTLVGAQSSSTDWEKAAGGKLSFEVASVKENKLFLDPRAPHNVNFVDSPTPTSGLLTAVNWGLLDYIHFAYNLDWPQVRSLNARLPKWARETGFDFEARTEGGLPEDQARLMMQSFLVDRFKLAVHFETKDGPAYALVLAKPGKLGSQMRAFPDGFPCSETPTSTPSPASEGVVGRGGDAPHPTVPAVDDGRLPASCGGLEALPAIQPGIMHLAGRDDTVKQLIELITLLGALDRPLVDRTGLSGTFDMALDLPLPPSVPPGVDGATVFREAVSDQLGLKLESITAPVDTLVIDHVERPTPN